MKKYKCKFCNYKGTREELITHIDELHLDMLPEGISPARCVFEIVYHKINGKCVVCASNTNWNENTNKYGRLCEKKSCREKLRDMYKTNMIRVHKTTTLLNDPEHQQKMLANRSISGTYSFEDGGKRTYTGSYEKKLLEFMDTVLKVHSDDVITPGPVLEYEYEGKKLKWITDVFYIPYNLVIEVKDGGSNPNNRQMDSYRDKQIKKEDMITSLGTYSYLRLTDNNFLQLLEVFMELKKNTVYDNKELVFKINETVNGFPIDRPYRFILDYNHPNSDEHEGFALTNDIHTNNPLSQTFEGKLVKEQYDEFLENRTFTLYKFKGDINKYNKILEDYKNDVSNNNINYIYETLTNRKMLIKDQISVDRDFEIVDLKENKDFNFLKNSILSIQESMNPTTIKIPIFTQEEIFKRDMLFDNKVDVSVVDVFKDMDGYFLLNKLNNRRSKSCEDIKDIKKEDITYVWDSK